ncbi:MAG: hypothetical protein AAFY14_11210 [Pseudomonadota bacterium]
MRLFLIALITLTACSNEANHLGNPLLLPISGVGTAVDNAAYNQRRGRVEVIVKSNFGAILNDIKAGGGPVLTDAMDAAGVPEGDRPTRIIQLQSNMGLYAANPGALVVALMVYGG